MCETLTSIAIATAWIQNDRWRKIVFATILWILWIAVIQFGAVTAILTVGRYHHPFGGRCCTFRRQHWSTQIADTANVWRRNNCFGIIISTIFVCVRAVNNSFAAQHLSLLLLLLSSSQRWWWWIRRYRITGCWRYRRRSRLHGILFTRIVGNNLKIVTQFNKAIIVYKIINRKKRFTYFSWYPFSVFSAFLYWGKWKILKQRNQRNQSQAARFLKIFDILKNRKIQKNNWQRGRVALPSVRV